MMKFGVMSTPALAVDGREEGQHRAAAHRDEAAADGGHRIGGTDQRLIGV
jgi:hypothetical protein